MLMGKMVKNILLGLAITFLFLGAVESSSSSVRLSSPQEIVMNA